MGKVKVNEKNQEKAEVNLNLHLNIRFQYRGKSNDKVGNKKRPSFEFKGGQEFSENKQKHVNRHYVIDRNNDNYSEKVTDPDTGEILHKTNVKLSNHKNHGSAKSKRLHTTSQKNRK